MDSAALIIKLKEIFARDSLFGFTDIEESLALQTGCKYAVVTLLPYHDMKYNYNPVEYYRMSEKLSDEHREKLCRLKEYLDENNIKYASPPAAPKNDGEYLSEFSYKWAAVHAGLGFIGKNDVFVSWEFAQRVRISCLLIDFPVPLPTFNGRIESKCGDCNLCVKACPHNCITGLEWHKNIKRSELIDYKKCATMSKHDGHGIRYLCANCTLACTYPNCV